MSEKDLKAMVEQERKTRTDAAIEILKKASEEIEKLGCKIEPQILVTPRGNVPQIVIISLE